LYSTIRHTPLSHCPQPVGYTTCIALYSMRINYTYNSPPISYKARRGARSAERYIYIYILIYYTICKNYMKPCKNYKVSCKNYKVSCKNYKILHFVCLTRAKARKKKRLYIFIFFSFSFSEFFAPGTKISPRVRKNLPACENFAPRAKISPRHAPSL